MKRFLYVVIPNSNKAQIQAVFNDYLLKPNTENLLKLIYDSLSFALADTNIKKIELEIKEIPRFSYYSNGRIIMSSKELKKAKKIENLPLILNSLFHELSHAIMHVKNYEILATKENAEKYMPILDLDRVTRALYSVTQDLDTACGGAMFFYRKNTNEYMARKFSYYLTKKYLEDYAPKYKFKMDSFEASEFKFQQSLYYDYPFMRNSQNLIMQYLAEYQRKCIEKGINNLTEDELLSLVATINVGIDNQIKDLLLKECVACRDINKVQILLNTPLIKLTRDEKRVLSNCYDYEFINQFVFSQDEQDRHIC